MPPPARRSDASELTPRRRQPLMPRQMLSLRFRAAPAAASFRAAAIIYFFAAAPLFSASAS